MSSQTVLVKELRPVTSSSIERDRYSPRVEACHTTIAPGSRACVNNKSNWLSYTQPEGQRYFQMEHENFSVVTQENVLNNEVDEDVSNWLAIIDKRILECGVALPQSCELFIKLHRQPHTSTCDYYFVDHHSLCLFWFEPTSSELLDMGMIVSDTHLDVALRRLYWLHVEFFPIYSRAHFAPDTLDDLVNVISHGMTDQLTSRTSTFPYSSGKCSQFLTLLTFHQGKPLDGPILCSVARLWGAIYNQRFMTYYGESNARLDRLQIMSPDDTVERPGIRALANLVLWGVPNHYYSELHDLFVNDQVYVDQWHAFMTACISEWRGACLWGFSSLIASILITMLPRASASSAVAPLLAALSSILSGSILLLRHHGFEDATSSFAARFLHMVKSSDWGFLPLSVVYSMPKALYLWSLGLMLAQFLSWVSRVAGILWALGGACFLALVGHGILYTTSLDYDLTGLLSVGMPLAFQSGSEEPV